MKINSNTKKEILNEIKKIEKKEGIKALFAIESGSRAWGWESEDSDYDIRGVYLQDYLTIDKEKPQLRTSIENSGREFDIELWDLRKFLRLMKKSNPSTWEWISSDIVYLESPLIKELRDRFSQGFSHYSLKKHYSSMAAQNFKKYIEGKEKVNLKKYLYVLRSVACVLWLEEKGNPPPKNYKEVISLLPGDIQKFFEKIIEEKKSSEKVEGKRNGRVDNFILKNTNKEFEKDSGSFNDFELNKIFKRESKKFS